MAPLSPRAFRYLQVDNVRIVRHPPLVHALIQLLDPPKFAWKLSERSKADIVRRYLAGEDIKDIATLYDVTPNAVTYHARKRGVKMRRPKR